jgi:tRNA(Met) C34 N-acetyltransferase TmcA
MSASPLAADFGTALGPWQARVLRSPHRQIILNSSRQVGKSTITSVLAAHAALYEPGAPVLLLSPSERQSVELLRKVKAGLAALGTTTTELEKDNTLSLEFASGSRIVPSPARRARSGASPASGCR